MSEREGTPEDFARMLGPKGEAEPNSDGEAQEKPLRTAWDEKKALDDHAELLRSVLTRPKRWEPKR